MMFNDSKLFSQGALAALPGAQQFWADLTGSLGLPGGVFQEDDREGSQEADPSQGDQEADPSQGDQEADPSQGDQEADP